MNTQTDVDNKENSNGPSTEDPSVDRYKNDFIYYSYPSGAYFTFYICALISSSPPPKSCLMEGSEFVNEDSNLNLMQGLNGKGGSWSFEELIDLGVHAKSKPLMDDGGPEGPRVAFEEKTSSIHPAQPIEALSGKGFLLLSHLNGVYIDLTSQNWPCFSCSLRDVNAQVCLRPADYCTPWVTSSWASECQRSAQSAAQHLQIIDG